jgi:hypothetical protein
MRPVAKHNGGVCIIFHFRLELKKGTWGSAVYEIGIEAKEFPKVLDDTIYEDGRRGNSQCRRMPTRKRASRGRHVTLPFVVPAILSLSPSEGSKNLLPLYIACPPLPVQIVSTF